MTMDNNNDIEETVDLSCPCYPQCPNYGKCRQCIAMHAKFWSMPKCVRMMTEEMKEKHIHPVNPHAKTPLSERIALFLSTHKGEHLRTCAKALKITDWQLFDALDSAVAVPKEDLYEVYGALVGCEKVMLHIDTDSVVLQLETKLPELIPMKEIGIVKKVDDEFSLTSLILGSTVYAVYLVREDFFGKESLSVAIVNEDEKTALTIYMRRGEDGNVLPDSKRIFESLWEKYATK